MVSRGRAGNPAGFPSKGSPSRGWGPMVGVSLALHLLAAGWIGQLPAASEVSVAERGRRGVRSALAPRGPRAGPPSTPRPGGVRSAQNVDAPQPGEEGDTSGAVAFVLLVSGAHGVVLQDSPNNSPGPSQVQRIRTAADRASWENRRATPNPHDDPFLASGTGRHPERRPVASVDPRPGARSAPEASSLGRAGGARGEEQPRRAHPASGESSSPGGEERPRRAEPAGGERSSPGRGILGGGGRRSSEAARVARGRPPVDEGPAATLARYPGRVRDDADAELLAGRLLQSVVDASGRRGRAPGPGRGGVGGGGEPGSGGGLGEGGRASPYGPGVGVFPALDTSDARYRRWYLQQRRRVEEALRYPRARALAMDQGTAVFRLILARDGGLVRPPRRLRSSGFPDLDAAALAAIERAAPFAPLPRDLAPDRSRVRIDLTVEFSNPMVR